MNNLFFFLKRKIIPGFKINKNNLVIDIGSGDKPFWRADVFLDNLSLSNNQRISGSKTIHDLGFFVDGDVMKMPFKNKMFDFSFCSHLLEHVENPELALKEITRISKSGYIEIPNGIIETIAPFHSHLWFIYKNGDQIIFIRKSKEIHNILIENGKKYKNIINKINDPFIRFYWKNEINYKIINNLPENEIFVADKIYNNSKKTLNLYLKFIKIIRLFFYKKKQIKID